MVTQQGDNSLINQVVKASGEVVEFNPEKLNKWAEWASGLSGVNWSGITLSAVRKCYEQCTTKELQQAMIDACCEKEDEAHFKMAGRLLIGSIYKEVFGGHDNIPTLKYFYHKMVKNNLWAVMDYSDEELDEINIYIKHEKDLTTGYTELNQIRGKYMLVDKVNDICFETPQFMYIGMAMANMESQPKSRRLKDIKKLYTYLSDKKINAPSPFMTNLRTNKKNYASCNVMTTHDTAESLITGDVIAYLMTCASAGIGHHIKTRSKGDPVRQGTVQHQGKLPYYRMTQAAVAANMQQGRGGSATMHFNALDPEIEDLLVLKNPTTTDQKRIKDIDYSFGANKLFMQKVAKNEDWMLCSYAVAPDLYESMYVGNQEEFDRLYELYDSNPVIKKSYVKARVIAEKALTEGVETGRMYLHFTDLMNKQTPFKDKIYSSNLC